MGEKPVRKKGKRTSVRLPDETFAKIQEMADRRGRSFNTTLVDLVEGGIDWIRSRYQIVK
jgi:predicted DNA-binding ribbon-helix-helix protein